MISFTFHLLLWVGTIGIITWVLTMLYIIIWDILIGAFRPTLTMNNEHLSMEKICKIIDRMKLEEVQAHSVRLDHALWPGEEFPDHPKDCFACGRTRM